MTQTELLALAKSCGFTASAPLDPASIELKQAVRDMCKENTCGQYGKRWSCPPGCGNLEQCRTHLSGYSTGLLVQTTKTASILREFRPSSSSISSILTPCTRRSGRFIRSFCRWVRAAARAAGTVPIQMRPAVSRRRWFRPWRLMVCWYWRSAKLTIFHTTTAPIP